MAVPGLVDAHCHLYGLGKALAEIDLVGTDAAAACVRIVAEAAAAQPAGWLQGRGWDQNTWSDQSWPHRRLLDDVVPGRAVVLRRVDGHAAWVSSEALRLAGITRETPDPAGGSIQRDAAGEPTGILVDNAVDLVLRVVPEPPADEVRRRVLLAAERCLAAGLTGVHEAGVSWERVALYRELAASGALGLRVYGMLDDQPATLAAGFAAGPDALSDDLIAVGAVKLYADGALGSRGALLLEDYADEPGRRGLQVTPTEHLRDVCRRAAAAGFQVCTHAIGDAANRLMLDLYEEVLGAELAVAAVAHRARADRGPRRPAALRPARRDRLGATRPLHQRHGLGGGAPGARPPGGRLRLAQPAGRRRRALLRHGLPRRGGGPSRDALRRAHPHPSGRHAGGRLAAGAAPRWPHRVARRHAGRGVRVPAGNRLPACWRRVTGPT